jgi:hypothetical protein
LTRERIRREEIKEALLDSLEELKPPSKLKEILTYLLIGIGGGVGLGILISFLRG